MIEKKVFFESINVNARDSKIRGLLFDINKDLFNRYANNLKTEEYICVCSGGTTSNCARNDFITLDLRKKFNLISYDKETEIVRVGGGVLMKDLLNNLNNHNRNFPIGLSNLPGMGYILTGGVSPLSRKHGLAIDKIVTLQGYLGNGKYFSLNKNKLQKDEIKLWEAIRGAAPFLSVVTEIGLKTIKSSPISVLGGFLEEKELREVIKISESFPNNISLQWIFTDKIYIYIVAEINSETDKINFEKYLKVFAKFSELNHTSYESFNLIKFFPSELELFELNYNFHSEVISLLGKDLKKNVNSFIEILSEINKNRPNRSCYVACQQLGGKTKFENDLPSFFVHRESSWKPWIFASWEKNNKVEKEISINWMIESWGKLKLFFPNIHLAQLHNHLNSHQEELNRAFDKKLDKLRILKNFCDPSGILPPL